LRASGKRKTVLGKEAAQFGNITYLQSHLLRLVGHWARCKMAQLVVTSPIWHLWTGCPWPKEAGSCCNESNQLAHQALSGPKQHKAAYDPDATIPGSPMSCCMIYCLNSGMVHPRRSIVRCDLSFPFKANKTRPLRSLLSLKCSSVVYRVASYALLYLLRHSRHLRSDTHISSAGLALLHTVQVALWLAASFV